jgi:AAA domain
MSAAPLVEDLPEISWEASQVIQSWRNVLAKAQGDREGIFERAAVELFRLTANDPNERRAIVDILHDMAVTAGIDDDEAQVRMARASKAPPDTRPLGMNGHKEPQPDPKRLRPIDLEQFLALPIKRREMVVDPIIPEKGLAMLYAPRGIGKTHVAMGLHLRRRPPPNF